MATNKNATTRYQTLDKCFRNPGKNYYLEDLIEECNESLKELYPNSSGISRRQIYDDIAYMESSQGWSIPLERIKDGRRVYYRYSDLSFSINNQPLNTKEAQQLKEAINTLSRFKGLPQFEWVEEMKVRLKQIFHLKNEKKAIEFDENIYLKGREYLSELYNAIVNNQTIKIQYTTFKDVTLDVVLSPYYLKEFNNRWFLFGFRHDNNRLMTLALDRIDSIRNTKTDFSPNIEVDFDEYFEDIIGVTLPEKPELEKIVLKVTNKRWPYIKTKPLHGSQKIKETGDTYTIIQLQLVINKELEALIHSFGKDIIVLGPESLKKSIMEQNKCLLEYYNNLFNQKG